MKGITQDFVWGVLVSLLVVAVSIIIFRFSNLENIVYNLILILMGTNLIVTSYYIIYISKIRLNPHEKLKEAELKLKAVKHSKKEAEKAYYSRKISESTYNKLLESFQREEITLKSQIDLLKSRN